MNSDHLTQPTGTAESLGKAVTKVLFLDIDGVLNSQRSCIAFGGFPHDVVGYERERFDEVALRLIRGIVKQAGAKVVLSSSWRITNAFDYIGKHLDLPIIDATPVKWAPGQVRGHEIADWLKRHPEVKQYVIVDDDPDMLGEQLPNFVHTNNFDGFGWLHAEKMCALFGIDIYDVNRPVATAWETTSA
jgi:hypothetical protein